MSKSNYRVAVLTASDKGFSGEREDASGPLIREIMQNAGYGCVSTCIVPDEQPLISQQLSVWCKEDHADLILTTGGTGLSPRDCTPEATLAIAHRQVPGIAEGMRAYSMQFTKRALFSRAVAVICHNTLVINLPGSPKAVREVLEFLLPELPHALDILRSNAAECATT